MHHTCTTHAPPDLQSLTISCSAVPGIYAATAIVMNFLMAVSLLPPAVIIYHRNFESKRNYW
jgi:hypothetical protein